MDNFVFKLAVENSGEHHIITDPEGVVIFANKAAEEITGYTIAEMKGKTPKLWGGLMSKEFYDQMWQTIKVEKRFFEAEIKNKRKNGEEYDAYTRISPILKEGQLIGFIGTEVDITKLKEVDRMKTEFVSLVTHQLRTPLATVQWSLEALKDQGSLNDKQKEILEMVYVTNQQMIELVNGLLDISRIETGKIVIEKTVVDMEKMIQGVIDMVKAKLTEKKQTINLQIGELGSQVITDGKLVSQVVMNFLTNAIRYSPEGAEIGLKTELNNGEMIIKVKDRGMGIPKEDQGHIFDRFYRARNAIAKVTEGTGLGLYLVKLIVLALGGEVGFVSEEGQGSEFYVRLPA